MSQDWQLIDSDNILQDEWLTIRRKRYRIRSGCDEIYHVLERSDFVLVAAIDASEQLRLVRQYRPATDRTYWALPGGYLNTNENPLEAAKRELLEETGLVAGRVTFVGELHPLPAYVRSAGHIFLCEDLNEDRHVSRDPEIEGIDIVPLDAAVQKIVSGEINEMQAVAAILLVREVLRRRAQS